MDALGERQHRKNLKLRSLRSQWETLSCAESPPDFPSFSADVLLLGSICMVPHSLPPLSLSYLQNNSEEYLMPSTGCHQLGRLSRQHLPLKTAGLNILCSWQRNYLT